MECHSIFQTEIEEHQEEGKDNTMKIYLLAGFLFFVAGGVKGQSPVQADHTFNFQECVRYALKHNLALSNSLLDVEKQHLKVKGARNNFFPSVGANAGYGLSRGRSVDPNTNGIVEREFFSSSYGLNANLDLFNGFRQHQLLSLENKLFKASAEMVEQQKNELAFQVLSAYLQHLINGGLVNIQQDQLHLSLNELHRVKKRIELGLASGGDFYEADARVAADEYQLLVFQNQFKSSENELKRLMNIPPNSPFQIQPVMEENLKLLQNYEADELFESAAHHLPRIKATGFQLEAAATEVHMSWSGMLPSFWAYAGMGSGFYETSVDDQNKLIPLHEQLKMNRRMNYGVSMSIPIFNRFRQHSAIQYNRINKKQIENKLRVELQTLEYNIQQAVLDREGGVAAYQAALKRKRSMEAAFEIRDKKREKGMISQMEFSEAKTKLAEAKTELLKTELQTFLNEQTIRFYLTGSIVD